MQTITIIFYVFFWGGLVYAALSVAYLLLLALAGNFFYKRVQDTTSVDQRIAVLIPGYREDSIIVSTAEHMLEVDYPKELYDIYVLADSFEPETVARLKSLPVYVLEVSFEISTKSRSLHEAFNRIGRSYDIAVICDADNILAKNVLKKINHAYRNGYKAIQARRVAKNLDAPFAILDACSEGINNHLFRKGLNAIGASSAVIGSGMAFDYKLIKNVFDYIHSLGGTITHEDKILQLKVVEEGHKIRYLDDALVFDEKVDSSAVFEQQRKRWISGQFIYLKKFFFPAFKQLFKGNVSYFHLAVTNNLVLPRAFLLLYLFLLTVAGLFIGPLAGIIAGGILATYFIVLFLALPPELINKDLFRAMLRIPRALVGMFGAVFQSSKKANKTFIHTKHTKTEVSNTLFND